MNLTEAQILVVESMAAKIAGISDEYSRKYSSLMKEVSKLEESKQVKALIEFAERI